MKGKKTIASLRDAAACAVAAWKIEADRVAGIIEKNLETLDANPEHHFLFNDKHALVLKDPEAVAAIVGQRIAQHEAARKRQAEEAAEREREKIRAEERAKAEAEAKAREAAERAEREKAEREAWAKAESDARSKRPATVSTPAPQAISAVATQVTTAAPTPITTPAAQSRPTDDQIIEVLALLFRVQFGDVGPVAGHARLPHVAVDPGAVGHRPVRSLVPPARRDRLHRVRQRRAVARRVVSDVHLGVVSASRRCQAR